MINTNDLRPGVAIELDGNVYIVLEAIHRMRGRGSALVNLKLKDLKTGNVVSTTLRAEKPVRQVFLERKPVQYLYNDRSTYHFMDTSTYEDLSLSEEEVGDAVRYLVENQEYVGLFYDGKFVGIELPRTVTLRVVETAPPVKGDTVSGGKPAKLETGITITVPFFVGVGDLVKVDTATGKYVERVTEEEKK